MICYKSIEVTGIDTNISQIFHSRKFATTDEFPHGAF